MILNSRQSKSPNGMNNDNEKYIQISALIDNCLLNTNH